MVVTGGLRRVGRAIAERFGRGGFDVVVTTRGGAGGPGALEAERAIGATGAAVVVERVHLDDPESVSGLAERLRADLPRIDVLVHNASVYEAMPLDGIDAARATRDYRVNALSPLVLSAGLAGVLGRSDRAGGGSIVAMADMHVLGRPRAGYASYAMSKAALVEMVRVLARELAPRVRVNGVAPGVVAWPEGGPESGAEWQRAYVSRVPMGRAGTAEEAAGAAWWVGAEASYVTGEVIRVDGGRWLG